MGHFLQDEGKWPTKKINHQNLLVWIHEGSISWPFSSFCRDSTFLNSFLYFYVSWAFMWSVILFPGSVKAFFTISQILCLRGSCEQCVVWEKIVSKFSDLVGCVKDWRESMTPLLCNFSTVLYIFRLQFPKCLHL